MPLRSFTVIALPPRPFFVSGLLGGAVLSSSKLMAVVWSTLLSNEPTTETSINLPVAVFTRTVEEKRHPLRSVARTLS